MSAEKRIVTPEIAAAIEGIAKRLDTGDFGSSITCKADVTAIGRTLCTLVKRINAAEGPFEEPVVEPAGTNLDSEADKAAADDKGEEDVAETKETRQEGDASEEAPAQT